MSIQAYTIHNGTLTATANSRTDWQQLIPHTRCHVSVIYDLTGSGASFTLYGSGFNDSATGGLQIGSFTYSPSADEAGKIEWDVDTTSPYIDLRYVAGSVTDGTINVIITRS